MCSLPSRYSSTILEWWARTSCRQNLSVHVTFSPYTALSIPFPEYHFQDSAVWIPSFDLSWCYWCFSEGMFLPTYRLLLYRSLTECWQQNDNNTVIHFLLSTEIIPLCLRIMETGSELSKTVAIFIVQKILLDDTGLTYICHTYERFYAVGTVLSNMVNQLVETQAVRLLKHVVRCYLRLSDNMRYVYELPSQVGLFWRGGYRARQALKACLPEPLRDNTFSALLKVSIYTSEWMEFELCLTSIKSQGDMVTKRCLTTLLNNLNEQWSTLCLRKHCVISKFEYLITCTHRDILYSVSYYTPLFH